MVRYIFKKFGKYKGEYNEYGDKITIWIRQIEDYYDLISTLIHEDLHRVITKLCPETTTTEQDHYIIKQLSF